MRAQRTQHRLKETFCQTVDAIGGAVCWLILIVAYLLAVSLFYEVFTASAKCAPSTVMVRATAYSWREPAHRKWGTKNAIGGSLARPLEGLGHCAVDPKVIPLGSVIEIPGIGRRIATDTGRLIRGRDLDIHFGSLREMRAWGARRVTVRVLRWGWGKAVTKSRKESNS